MTPERIPISDVKRLNKSAGLYWFEPDTLRFFRSRVASHAYKSTDGAKAYLVSSEQGPDMPRRYSVRVCDLATGRIDTVGEFQSYKNHQKASRAVLFFAKGGN